VGASTDKRRRIATGNESVGCGDRADSVETRPGILESADIAGRNGHNSANYQTLIIFPSDGSGGSALAALQKPILEVRVETICERGCRLVWDAIERLERGEQLPETADLSPSERDWVLAELKSVMAVYGGRCRVD
jgi:hypothetical protein